MEALLSGEGVVRARVPPTQMDAALKLIAALPDVGAVAPSPDGHGWLTVRIPQERAAEVTRALAVAGIYLSGLDTGSDLESIFLELTAPVDAAAPSSREARR
jgi:hypothetical protein